MLIESRLFSRGRGRTEETRHGLREPRRESYLGPAPVVQKRSREDRPGSLCKFARGPMNPSANRRSSSLIIQGPDPVRMPTQNSSSAESSRRQRRPHVRQSSVPGDAGDRCGLETHAGGLRSYTGKCESTVALQS